MHYNGDPDDCRPRQTVEVPDDFSGDAYCSIECAAYDGIFKVGLDKPE
jgi:hypothetical protein